MSALVSCETVTSSILMHRSTIDEIRKNRQLTRPWESKTDRPIVRWSSKTLGWNRSIRSSRAVWTSIRTPSSCSLRAYARYRGRNYRTLWIHESSAYKHLLRSLIWTWPESGSFGHAFGRCSASISSMLARTRIWMCPFLLSTPWDSSQISFWSRKSSQASTSKRTSWSHLSRSCCTILPQELRLKSTSSCASRTSVEVRQLT